MDSLKFLWLQNWLNDSKDITLAVLLTIILHGFLWWPLPDLKLEPPKQPLQVQLEELAPPKEPEALPKKPEPEPEPIAEQPVLEEQPEPEPEPITEQPVFEEQPELLALEQPVLEEQLNPTAELTVPEPANELFTNRFPGEAQGTGMLPDPILLPETVPDLSFNFGQNSQPPESLPSGIDDPEFNPPEPNEQERLTFWMDNSDWDFANYMEFWGKTIQKWWNVPNDYINGAYPKGGSVWVETRLSLDGELVDFKQYRSNVSAEMELRAIQALISSFRLPPLPTDLEQEVLVVRWRFIYPPLKLELQK